MNQGTYNSNAFNLETTNIAKGFAVLLLLLHHLFYKHPEYGDWLYIVAIKSKVCVSLFVLLSGYGLAASYKMQSWCEWYGKRYTKLYMNYWFIMLIFIPVSWIAFGNSVYDVFPGDRIQAWLKFLSQIAGTHMFYGGFGFNATWWFISAIIVLYLLFPIFNSTSMRLHCFPKKRAFLFQVLFLVFIGSVSHFLVMSHFLSFFWFGESYIPAFAFGIVAAHEGWFNRFFCKLSVTSVSLCAICGVVIPFICWLMQDSHINALFLLISIWFCWVSAQISAAPIPWVRNSLVLLGRHSMNMFLTHTFIYSIFFHDFFYSLPHPALMYFLLLGASLGVSVLIMQLQRVLKYGVLISKIQSAFH